MKWVYRNLLENVIQAKPCTVGPTDVDGAREPRQPNAFQEITN